MVLQTEQAIDFRLLNFSKMMRLMALNRDVTEVSRSQGALLSRQV